MQTITLNLTVSITIAIKILNLMNDEELAIGNLEDYTNLQDSANVEPKKVVEIVKAKTTEVQKSYTLDDIRHIFMELAQSKGKDVAKQVIADLGFKRVTEIPETMFNTAFDKVKEAM